MRWRWCVLVLVAGLLAAACGAGGSGGEVVESATSTPVAPAMDSNTEAPTPEATTTEPEAEAGGDVSLVLNDAGYSIDRTVELPGTDKVAVTVLTTGAEALDAWSELKALVPQTGRFPAITGSWNDSDSQVANNLDTHIDYASDESASLVSDLLTEAGTISGPDWFAEQLALEAQYEWAELLEVSLPLPDMAPWTTIGSVNSDYGTGAPYDVVEITLFPTPHGWEIPAYLQLGGWNAVPFAPEQVAVWRYWHETYGADPVVIFLDVVEMMVASPPTTDEAAAELAVHYAMYAPDILWQGIEDINLLAAGLKDSQAWYFWWD